MERSVENAFHGADVDWERFFSHPRQQRESVIDALLQWIPPASTAKIRRWMSAHRLELRLLGPLKIVRDGTAAELPRSRKVLALLAYLALEGGDQSRSRLCDLLWDG